MVVLVLVIPLAIFLFSVVYNASTLPPPPPLPNPNGYDDLTKSATMLASNVGTYNSSNLTELQAIVSEDSNALQLARTGLQKECRVPLDYDPTGSNNVERLASMKRLTAAFAAEGDLAVMQGHPNEAAGSYLDMIHLANESSRSGVLINELVGIAIERRGTDKLHDLIPKLDAKSCRETAATLVTLDAQKQTWDEVIQQEHDWSRRTFPGIRYELIRLMSRSDIEKMSQKAGRKFEDQQTKTRELIVDFAASAYELDNGHPPASLSDLVTNYLETVPIDPATGTNMIYLPR